MENNNENIESVEMANGKSYPSVLTDVVSEYDYIRKVYVVSFIYKVYLNASQTKEVVDNFYMWDHPTYKRVSLERLDKLLDAYNLKLIYKDYRNEMTITNACKWLVGTKVEIQQYRYKGIKYKVLSTERNQTYRVSCLWECMLKNDLDSFPECLEINLNNLLDDLDSVSSNSKYDILDTDESLKDSSGEISTCDDLITDDMYHELEFNISRNASLENINIEENKMIRNNSLKDVNPSEIEFIDLVSMAKSSTHIFGEAIKTLQLETVGKLDNEKLNSLKFNCFGCINFYLELDKNKIEESLIKELLHFKQAVGFIIKYKDGLMYYHGFPDTYLDENTRFNIFQRISVEENIIRISVSPV